MADQTKDWRRLCEAAVKELDPEKFLALIIQLNQALDERDRRLNDGVSDQNERMRRSSATGCTAESYC